MTQYGVLAMWEAEHAGFQVRRGLGTSRELVDAHARSQRGLGLPGK